MAQVTDDFVPTVAPRETPPDDYQHIPVNESQFNQVAQGEKALGQGAEQASNNAFGITKFWGEVQADGATNGAMKEMNDVVGNYQALRGQDALDAQKDTNKRIEDIYAQHRQGLTTAAQQYQYDNAIRNYQNRYVAGIIRTHATQQALAHATTTNQDAWQLAINGAANVADDPQQVDMFLHDARSAKVRQVMVEGNHGDSTIVAAAIAQSDKALYKTVTEAKAVKSPAAALKYADEHRAELGDQYDNVYNSVRARADAQIGDGVASRAMATANGAPGTPGPIMPAGTGKPIAGLPGGFVAAIQAEEGFDPVPRWDVKQWTVGYGTRASGPDERASKAELDARFENEITKAAAIVEKVNPNLDPGTKAALTSLTYNTGTGWTQAGLGAAVRAGDLAKAKEAFLTYNNVDQAYDPSVAQRRQREAQWFQAAAPPAEAARPPTIATMKASAYQVALNDPVLRGNPNAQQHALTRINQAYAAAQIASDQTKQQAKEVSDAAYGEYLERMGKKDFGQNGAMVQEILSDRRMLPEARHTLASFAAHLSGNPASLVDLGPGYLQAMTGVLSAPGTPGHIADPAEILTRSLPDRGIDPALALTPAGALEVNKAMAIAKKQDGVGLLESKHQIEKDAHDYLSWETPEMRQLGRSMRDAKGERFYSKWLLQFNSEYNDWVNAGKSPYEFLKKADAELEKTTGAIRSKRQKDLDFLHAQDEALGTAANTSANTQLPPVPAGIDPTGWATMMRQVPLAPKSGQPWPYAKWAHSLQVLTDNPTPKMIEDFNEHFGPAGYDAKEILHKLGKEPLPQMNLEAADQEMHLTPQERSLYERHLANLYGAGGVDNPDGSRSSLYQVTAEIDGKAYVLPTVYGGKILQPADAVKRAEKEGLAKFPSYATEDEAEARYRKMHDFMERDTADYLAKRKAARRGARPGSLFDRWLDYYENQNAAAPPVTHPPGLVRPGSLLDRWLNHNKNPE